MNELQGEYAGYFTAEEVKATLNKMAQAGGAKRGLYWRILTPLVMLWGLIYQRVNADHSQDGVLTHLKGGGADHLAQGEGGQRALSKRLSSESTSSYAQGRERLPSEWIRTGVQQVSERVQASQGEAGRWKGHAVRWLDGTTYRLPSFGDLATSYGQARNQHGAAYWVTAKSLAAFDWGSDVVVGYAEGRNNQSEASLFGAVIQMDGICHSVYIGDEGLGQYRVAQVAVHNQQHVLLRLSADDANKLYHANGGQGRLTSGSDVALTWIPDPHIKTEPELAASPIRGRVIYVQVRRNGYRPVDLYVFTTLLDQTRYTLDELISLYTSRWHVEINYRTVKSSLDMDEFDVHSAAMFRTELAAGLLAYNLVRALMVKAALTANLPPARLSFTRCLRRILYACQHGFPDWVYAEFPDPTHYLIQQLAACRLPNTPHKVPHEPRAVRRRPQVFPNLKGSRNCARSLLLDQLAGTIDPAKNTNS